MRKIFTNIFIVAALLLMGIDGLPAFGPFHERLKEKINPFFDVTGLWQGEWGLFAPEPAKVTRRVGVEIVCADGITMGWGSPYLNEHGRIDQFLGFRGAEFYDAIVMNDNKEAWPCFLDYIVEDYGRKTCGAKNIVRASLIRYFEITQPPGKPRTTEQSVVILTKEYTP